jgi:hypothetical protein
MASAARGEKREVNKAMIYYEILANLRYRYSMSDAEI